MREREMGIEIGGQIEKVNGKNLSYNDFVERYLSKNKPVVLTGLMDNWRACKDWVTLDGKPNLNFFSVHFGNSKVQVADCGTREFTDQKRLEMNVSEFIDRWLGRSIMENGRLSSNEATEKPLLYLKDWHFVKEYPEYVAYETPQFFRDDWLNLYLDHFRMHKDPDVYQENDEICCSDYRFVYMGPKGSWTPLHADVFRSYSWSANVCGKKKWLFLSPSQCHLVFDRNLKSSVYNIFDYVSETKFPEFRKAVWLECTQDRNEIIFVPSGWFHQVHNLEDTISINHNWFNAHNLSWVWDLLLKDYKEAKEYIEDIKDICDDFEGLCQRNLAANTGMNFFDFFTFLSRFFLANAVQLYSRDSGIPDLTSAQLARHFAFNVISIRDIALRMKSIEALAGNNSVFQDFKEILDDPDFLKLCSHLGITYVTIHNPDTCNNHIEKACMPEFLADISRKSSPADFISFIDNALEILGGICCRETNFLCGLDNFADNEV